MRRDISLYTRAPEKKGLFLSQQHKCTQKVNWTAENVTMAHPYCENSADVLGRGTQVVPRSQAVRHTITMKLAGL